MDTELQPGTCNTAAAPQPPQPAQGNARHGGRHGRRELGRAVPFANDRGRGEAHRQTLHHALHGRRREPDRHLRHEAGPTDRRRIPPGADQGHRHPGLRISAEHGTPRRQARRSFAACERKRPITAPAAITCTRVTIRASVFRTPKSAR